MNWLIIALLGGAALLVLSKPGSGQSAAPDSSPNPPSNPPQGATGTPGFTSGGSGNDDTGTTMQDFTSWLSGRVVPNSASLRGKTPKKPTQQAVTPVPPLQIYNTNSVQSNPSSASLWGW